MVEVCTVFLIASCGQMPRDNRCMFMEHVCFYVEACGNVCCVVAVVKKSVFFSLKVLKYVVCLCSGCDGCCVFCLYCEAWSCRCSCIVMQMLYVCVHPVAVITCI